MRNLPASRGLLLKTRKSWSAAVSVTPLSRKISRNVSGMENRPLKRMEEPFFSIVSPPLFLSLLPLHVSTGIL